MGLLCCSSETKSAGTDGALELYFATIVIVKILVNSTTTRTDGVCWNSTFGVFANGRFDLFFISFVKVPDELFIISKIQSGNKLLISKK